MFHDQIALFDGFLVVLVSVSRIIVVGFQVLGQCSAIVGMSTLPCFAKTDLQDEGVCTDLQPQESWNLEKAVVQTPNPADPKPSNGWSLLMPREADIGHQHPCLQHPCLKMSLKVGDELETFRRTLSQNVASVLECVCVCILTELWRPLESGGDMMFGAPLLVGG